MMRYVLYGAGIWFGMGAAAMVIDGVTGAGWFPSSLVYGPLALYSTGSRFLITKPAAPQLPAGVPSLKAV